MKTVYVLLLFLFPLIAYAQEKYSEPFLLTEDSLSSYPNYITHYWKFSEGDDTTMSSLSYDDSKWREVESTLMLNESPIKSFKGMGWFRLHIIVDSTVAGKMLAMTITHLGASEIYVDGKLIKSFGKINGPDSSEYYDPESLPFIFTAPTSGEHLLAVRYANYKAQKNFKAFNYRFAGFKMSIGDTEGQIHQGNLRSIVFTLTSMLLGGIFLALAIIHLFLFLYHRIDLSNLFFSGFMFAFALLFIEAFLAYVSTSPVVELWNSVASTPLIVLASISLSAFINTLFGKKKWRTYILIALGVAAFIFRIFPVFDFRYLIVGIMISVSFEAVFTIIFAIIKGVQGAKIIGAGILFFSLLLLTLYTIAMASGGTFDLNDSTLTGQILIILLALAIVSIPISMSLYQAWRFARINSDLALQLEQVKTLSQKTLEQEQEKQLLLQNRKEELEKEVSQRTADLVKEKKKSDDLLLNILPAETAEELKATGAAEAKNFDEVTVMFTDFKNFTKASEQMNAKELVNEINYLFSEFDKIISKHDIEKIKTIGDSYMCAGGLPVANKTNAMDVVDAALEIQQFMNQVKAEREKENKHSFEIRIGIHSGPVVAGIVGIKKFAYDIWGDTVNIASRMESSGEAGKVNISGATYELVKEKFTCTYRGKIPVKNKGEAEMFFVEGIK